MMRKITRDHHKKNKIHFRRSIAFVLAGTLILTSSVSAAHWTVYADSANIQESNTVNEYENFKYTVLPDHTISICGYRSDTTESPDGEYLEIPASIHDTPVTNIAQEAFANHHELKAILIPETIQSIDDSAFNRCENLQVISFCGPGPQFGTTLAKGSRSIQKIFSLKSNPLSNFFAVLENDLGEAEIKQISMEQFDDLSNLKKAFSSYVAGLQAIRHEQERNESKTDVSSGNTDPGSAQNPGKQHPEEAVHENPAEPSAVQRASAESSEGEGHPVQPEAAPSVVAQGECGQALTWTLDQNGVLTIEGSGEMNNFTGGGSPWYRYADQITSIVLKEGMTSIGSYAFYSCSKAANDLVIPDSVIQIHDRAFSNMKALPSIQYGKNVKDGSGGMVLEGDFALKRIVFTGAELPSNLYWLANAGSTALEMVEVPKEAYSAYGTSLGRYLNKAVIKPSGVTDEFYVSEGTLIAYCGMQAEVKIPESVQKIGPAAFLNQRNIRRVEIPDHVTDIANYAFSGCTNLESLNLPENLVTIGNAAFRNCSKWQGDIRIPDLVRSIGEYAFYQCTGLSGYLDISSHTETIGQSAFAGCTNIRRLTLGNQLKNIGSYAFYNCPGMTGELNLPESLESIGESAFMSCTGFSGILRLPSRLSEIPANCFYGCEGFSGELVIPDAVKRIGEHAFANQNGLTSVVFGKGFSYGRHPFAGCNSIRQMTFKSKSIPAEVSVAVGYATAALETVYVPQESYREYAAAFGGNIGNARIQASGENRTFVIENDVLLAYSGEDEEVRIPDNVRMIGDAAFQNNRSIRRIHIPEHVTGIGRYAFAGCTGLTEIQLPSGLKELGTAAFSGCSALTGDLIIPDGLVNIPAWAFRNCSKLNGRLVIGAGVQTIGYGAFAGCTGLNQLVFEGEVSRIESDAFSNCTGFRGELKLPDSLAYIGRTAFRACTGFSGELKLPDSLTYIGPDAFYGCAGFTGRLRIPDRVNSLGYESFASLHRLTSIILGKNVRIETNDYGGGYPFAGCTSVKEMTFTGTTVPDKAALFVPREMYNSLETVYVPAAAYDAYVSRLSGSVGHAVFSTNVLGAKVENLEASSIYSKSIGLQWNRHISEQVIGYTIKRDGTEIGTTSQCSFTDRSLESGRTYLYTVTGYTSDGKVTEEARISVTPKPPTITEISVGNKANKVGNVNSLTVTIANERNLDALSKQALRVELYYEKNGEEILIGKGTPVEDAPDARFAGYQVTWDISSIPDGEYEVLAKVTDIDDSVITRKRTVVVDHSVPERLADITAVGDSTAIHVNWSIAKEANVVQYRIYRKAENETEFSLIAQADGRQTLTYMDENVQSDTLYEYYVTAVNDFLQEGAESQIVSAAPVKDTQKPLILQFLPSHGGTLSGNVLIEVAAQDNVGVVKTELYISTDQGQTWNLKKAVASGRLTDLFDTKGIADGRLSLKAVAFDGAGNQSSARVNTYLVDNTGPEKIQNLRYDSTDISAALSWDNVTDEDIFFYRVEKRTESGEFTRFQDVYDKLGIQLSDLAPDTEMIYRVTGYDLQGNRGIPSEEILVKTKKDEIRPVITKIRPAAGYFANEIPISITAEDEYCVSQITLQLSMDGMNWEDIYTEHFDQLSRSNTLTYQLSTKEFPEGFLYIRGIGTDRAGNKSDESEAAPFVQHFIDRTAPSAPGHVSAAGHSGYIEIAWEQGKEPDLGTYSILRIDAETGAYQEIATGLRTLNFIDRQAAAEHTYSYQVYVSDLAGNVSLPSNPVSAMPQKDTENPVIRSIYPADGTSIGKGFRSVHVLATDNQSLESVKMEYSHDGNRFSELETKVDRSAGQAAADAMIPVEEFEQDETVYVRIHATDRTGNTSEDTVVQYNVDIKPPVITEFQASYEEDSIVLHWIGKGEPDLIGYRIYRKDSGENSYHLIGQRAADQNKTEMHYYDYLLPKESARYMYQIEAEDSSGNVSSAESEWIEKPDRTMPSAVLSCDSIMEAGVEYVIDATLSTDNSGIVSYQIDFGDGQTGKEKKAIHVYSKPGSYTIALTVTDDQGNQSTCIRQITVRERGLLGNVRIHMVNESGNPMPNAPVYFDLGEETQTVKYTDGNGIVMFTGEVGKHTVGSVIPDNQWLPARKDILLTSGSTADETLVITRHIMIDGKFETRRMTFSEIVAAGIDVKKPENQNIIEITAKLYYENKAVETSMTYNVWTKETIGKPTIISTPGGEKREIIPVAIGSRNELATYEKSKDISIAYLDIPVGVSALKEFFQVNLHIINYSDENFSMLDNSIQLNVPKGLSIVDTYVSNPGENVNIAEIKGQSEKVITWIMRGDEVGEYYLSADYSGILSQFNEPIHTRFVATQPLTVRGLSDMKLTLVVPDELDNGMAYYDVALSNEGKEDVYLPDISTNDTLIEMQLINPTQAKIIDRLFLHEDFSYEKLDSFELTERVTGTLDVLHPGYRLLKHYAAIESTTYTEFKKELKNNIEIIGNTYGMQVEVVVKPLSYFKSNLSVNINPIEKAEKIIRENQGAYDYLMTDENYVYWNMFAGSGKLAESLPSDAAIKFWKLIQFDAEGFLNADDPEKIRALIMEAMEAGIKDDQQARKKASTDLLEGLVDWVAEEGKIDVKPIVEEWYKKQKEKAKDKIIKQSLDELAEVILYIFGLSVSDEKEKELTILLSGGRNYQVPYSEVSADKGYFSLSNEEFVRLYNLIVGEESADQTALSKLFQDLLSKGSRKVISKLYHIEEDVLGNFRDITNQKVDTFVRAQSSLDSMNLFLDMLIRYIPDSKLGTTIKKEAQDIKNIINRSKFRLNLFEVADQLFEAVGKTGIQSLGKFVGGKWEQLLNMGDPGVAKLTSIGLKLGKYVGNRIFHLNERQDITENIRFLALMSEAMRTGISEADRNFRQQPTEDTAKTYLQSINILLNLREIGESQAMKFGQSYELADFPTSYELLQAVKGLTGASDAISWIQWLDFVEDKIAWARIELLRNPVAVNLDEQQQPIVTFDYSRGQTVQSFSAEYEYSLDYGSSWRKCTGGPIQVTPAQYSRKLLVRRHLENAERANPTGVTTINGIPALDYRQIRVLRTKQGYRVENLNPEKQYEISFMKEKTSYDYGARLGIEIPKGSSSYRYESADELPYIYIRTLSDAHQYASYIYEPKLVPMVEVNAEVQGYGILSGQGSYEDGQTVYLTAAASLDNEFIGWYENDKLISTESVLTFQAVQNRSLQARFRKLYANWSVNDSSGMLQGLSENTTIEDILEYFKRQNKSATVGNGDSASKRIGTGEVVKTGEHSYAAVVFGDVNGDALVDRSDLYAMLAHMNSEKPLSGAFWQAGKIRGREDIDIFDIYAEISYINNGSFHVENIR